MKSAFLSLILAAGALSFAASAAPVSSERDLIAVLQSSKPSAEKWDACQKLRVVGTPACIPALASLLTDEQMSQAARHTLEALAAPEANTALLSALPKVSALLKAGIADSLGWRKDPQSVGALSPLLKDPDGDVAAAAASALGRIGTQPALEALNQAADAAPPALQPIVQEALLKCAEQAVSASKPTPAAAAAVYRKLSDPKYSDQVRAAAWRGLILAEPERRTARMLDALSGKDRPVRIAACKLIRELEDRPLISTCAQHWADLPAEAQLAVLEAQVRFGSEAMSTVDKGSKSSDPILRQAAWQAMGELGLASFVPALAKAAVNGESFERETARASLARLRGQGARESLLEFLSNAAPAEKAAVLRALGDRDDQQSAAVLLENAAAADPAVSLAALESLTRLAPPDAGVPLLEVAAKAGSDEEREQAFKALYAIVERSPDKDRTAGGMVEAIDKLQVAQRRPVLALLAELGTASALASAERTSHSQDPELAKEAVRVLSRWPNAAPAMNLLELSKAAADPTVRTLALRAAIEVSGQESDPARRLSVLERALQSARQPEEKKQALGQLGQVPSEPALKLALNYLQDGALKNEAALAAVSIAEKLAGSDPSLGDKVAAKVLGQFDDGDVARRAWALRIKPSSAASFIREWVVAGPFRQAGLVGATAVYTVAFSPEKQGQTVPWQAIAPSEHVNLAGLFPGQENCVAYLRTYLIAPAEGGGALLLGSDDGVKAWLNGEVVLNRNVDRGEVVDQDVAPIKLKKGTNELLLKVSQGGGGWSVSARVVGTDGQPIPGLMVSKKPEP